MSNGTLTYGSVDKWMSLAVWASRFYYTWNANTFYPREDEKYTELFHAIAVEALNRGFSLRVGYRDWAVRDLLRAIAFNPDEAAELLDAFDRIDRETWLTPVGAKPDRKSKDLKGEVTNA